MIPTDDGFLGRARRRIVSFVEEQVEEAGAEGGVVAMSGGVDSSLVAALAAEALGPSGVMGVSLPQSGISLSSDLDDARTFAEELGVEWGSSDVAEAVEATVSAGSELTEPTDRALVNVAPRVRMALTYFVANSRDMLVLGTGNRSELLLGYFTKHGDGAADVLPIGDLYKTQVFELARRAGVPESIVGKEPSAGLYRGQTDREELGFGYGEVDPVLGLIVDEGLGPAEAAERTGLSVDDVEVVLEMVESSRHKRMAPPTPGLEKG